jgi:hypothetical protein
MLLARGQRRALRHHGSLIHFEDETVTNSSSLRKCADYGALTSNPQATDERSNSVATDAQLSFASTDAMDFRNELRQRKPARHIQHPGCREAFEPGIRQPEFAMENHPPHRFTAVGPARAFDDL